MLYLECLILGRKTDFRRKRIKSASILHQFAIINAMHPPTSKSASREIAANSDLGSRTNSVSDKVYELARSRVSIGNSRRNCQATSALDK